MGKSSPSPPPAPDPVATAQAQGAANKEAAIASQELAMINQQTPWGTLGYEQIGTSDAGTPRYQATTTLSPEQQQMLNLTNQAGIKYGETANTQLDAVRSRLEQPLDFSSMNGMSGIRGRDGNFVPLGTFGPEIQRMAPQGQPLAQGGGDPRLANVPILNDDYINQTTERILARAQPQIDRRYEQLRTSLANQGFTDPNSEGYKDAMLEYDRGLNDMNLAAQNQALNMASQRYGLEANARDKAINEIVLQRTQPLNELAAMLSGTQVQGPQFIGTPAAQVSPADVMGATYGSYNGNLANWQQQQANRNAMTGGLFGLGGSILGAGFMPGGFLL